jgi:hypothetical protein
LELTYARRGEFITPIVAREAAYTVKTATSSTSHLISRLWWFEMDWFIAVSPFC